jgi:GTP-binding protein HflX
VPVLLVWSKADLAPRDDLKRLLAQHSVSVAISATTGDGIDDLLRAIGERLRALARVAEYLVPYDRGDVLAALHRAGEVLVEVHADAGTRVQARLPEASAGRFADFAVTRQPGRAAGHQ